MADSKPSSKQGATIKQLWDAIKEQNWISCDIFPLVGKPYHLSPQYGNPLSSNASILGTFGPANQAYLDWYAMPVHLFEINNSPCDILISMK